MALHRHGVRSHAGNTDTDDDNGNAQPKLVTGRSTKRRIALVYKPLTMRRPAGPWYGKTPAIYGNSEALARGGHKSGGALRARHGRRNVSSKSGCHFRGSGTRQTSDLEPFTVSRKG
jgi:hypothetical protein